MVKKMFEPAKVDGTYTNHSLRQSACYRSLASSLFNAGVPEAVSTGHKSTEAVRLYERVSDDQQVAVSNILASGSKKLLMKKKTSARSETKPIQQPIQQGDDTSFGQNQKSQNRRHTQLLR